MRAATATPTTPATIAGRPEKVAAPFDDDDDELGADELSAADDEPLSDEVGPLDSELEAPAPPAPPDEEPASDEEAADDDCSVDDCSDDELRERREELPEVAAPPAAPPPLPPDELLPPLDDEEPPPFEQSVEPWPTVTGAEAAP